MVQTVQQMWQAGRLRGDPRRGRSRPTIINDFVLGNFQAATSYQFGAVTPDLNYVWWSTTTISPIGTHRPQLHPDRRPELEAAMLQGRHTTDQATRVAAYRTVNERLAEDLPYLWIEQYLFSEVASERVQNFDNRTLPNGMPGYAFDEGYLLPAPDLDGPVAGGLPGSATRTPMATYLLRRVVQLVVVTFIISVLVFLLVHLLPGNPATVILGTNDNPHNQAVLYKQLGLNKPLFQQYLTWLGSVFHGNLGQSYLNHESVTHIIATGWPIDLELIIISQVIAFGVAIPLALVDLPPAQPTGRQRRHHRHLRHAGPSSLRHRPDPGGGLRGRPGVVPGHRVRADHPEPHQQHPRHDPPLAGHHRRIDRRVLPAVPLRPDQHPAGGLHHHGPVEGPLQPSDHVAARLPTLLLLAAGRPPGSTSVP